MKKTPFVQFLAWRVMGFALVGAVCSGFSGCATSTQPGVASNNADQNTLTVSPGYYQSTDNPFHQN